MAAGSRDRPPMLAPGRYLQCRSRFLRYVDTRPNGEALRKCILSGPYKPTTVVVHAIEATDDSLAVLEHTTIEMPMNMSPKNKALFLVEKEAIHLILTGIGDDIYSTVDACQTAQEMWEAIERLQQGEFLNIQDLQPEWSRFVTIVKQQHKLDEVSYHKLFDILKQYQNEVNELRAEKLDMDEEVYEQELEGHYSYMARIQEVPAADSGADSVLVEHVHNDTGYNVFANALKHSEQSEITLWRTVNVAGTKEKVGSQVVQKSGIQCFNYMDEEVYEQELEGHYSYMAKIQEVPAADSGTDSVPVEHVHNDTGYNVFANALKHSEQSEITLFATKP
nr:hypothetical protein [Tanacetum cinerariifolium]